MKSYIVISTSSGLKLRQQPEMKKPAQYIYNRYYASTRSEAPNEYKVVQEYAQHLADIENNLIDIAPKVTCWKEKDVVKEGEFELKDVSNEGFEPSQYYQYVAIPKQPLLEQEKESELTNDELYESIYMEVVQLVEKDNIQCEEYLATVKKLAANYHITKK